MFDATLSLKTVEGTTLCSTNITVLWVDISMRCGQDDVDTPGFPNYFLTAFPEGHYYLLRLNFAQYAVFNNRRCANDFFWFSRTTVVRTLQDGHYVFEFLNRSGRMDDNVSGTGGTDVLW